MKNEMVRCGCGGEGQVLESSYTNCYVVQCGRCGIRTPYMNTETEAVMVWNKAMGNRMELQTVERTAKVEENRCTVCDNHIRPCMRYCDHCGARLEWE